MVAYNTLLLLLAIIIIITDINTTIIIIIIRLSQVIVSRDKGIYRGCTYTITAHDCYPGSFGLTIPLQLYSWLPVRKTFYSSESII